MTHRAPEPASRAPAAASSGPAGASRAPAAASHAAATEPSPTEPHVHVRPRRRGLGAGLIAFGLVGLLLIGAAGVLLFGSLSAVNDAATDFERQRLQIQAMLGPASDALDSAATSAGNAGASLAETSEAAAQAARLTTRLAESFEGLQALSSFEILGARPFGSLAGQFAAVAFESRTLSEDLDAAATSLATNITDSEQVARDLRLLADQLEVLETSLGAPPTTPATPSSTLPLDLARLVVAGLLAWLAIPAIASIWLGLRFLRGPRGA